MLRTKRLLICLTVVTFCFAGTVPAKACGDWDSLLDCYMDSNGDIWMLWWDCYDWCFRWVCLEDLWPSDTTQSTSSEPGMAVAGDRNPFIDSPAAEAQGKVDLFVSGFNPDGGKESINFGNAIAHQEDGQNVLFLDSHVGFAKEPYVGINDDNIYTNWDGGDIRRGAIPFVGAEPQIPGQDVRIGELPLPGVSEPADRLDSLLVSDGEGGAG